MALLIPQLPFGRTHPILDTTSLQKNVVKLFYMAGFEASILYSAKKMLNAT